MYVSNNTILDLARQYRTRVVNFTESCHDSSCECEKCDGKTKQKRVLRKDKEITDKIDEALISEKKKASSKCGEGTYWDPKAKKCKSARKFNSLIVGRGFGGGLHHHHDHDNDNESGGDNGGNGGGGGDAGSGGGDGGGGGMGESFSASQMNAVLASKASILLENFSGWESLNILETLCHNNGWDVSRDKLMKLLAAVSD